MFVLEGHSQIGPKPLVVYHKVRSVLGPILFIIYVHQ